MDKYTFVVIFQCEKVQTLKTRKITVSSSIVNNCTESRVWCLEDGRGDPPDEGDGAGEVVPHEVDEGSVHLEELLPEDADLLLLLPLAQPGGATLNYLQTHPANVWDCSFTPLSVKISKLSLKVNH